jgi:hypothetical protein
VLHECDVLVLPVTEANLSRNNEVAPRGTRSLIAIECKYYAGHLSLQLARGFHGLHADLGVKNPYFIANLQAQRIQRYLTYLGRNWESGVMPHSQEATFFVGQLREAFKKYQSSEGSLALLRTLRSNVLRSVKAQGRRNTFAAVTGNVSA